MTSNVAAMPLTVRWYRNRGRCLLIYGGAAIPTVALAYLIIGKNSPVWIVLGGLAILVAIWQIAGAALAGYGVSRDALIVRSPFGFRHRVPWTQIASFNVSRPGPRTESVVLGVRTNGRLLHTGGCTFRAGAKGHARAVLMAAELNTDRLARSDADAPATLAPRSRASHRSPGRFTPVRSHRGDFTVGLVCGIVFLAFGAGFLAPSIAAVGPAYRAAHGQGVRGSFVAVTEHCGKGCFWRGNFVLPDGTVTHRNVYFNVGTSRMSAGQSVPALDAGDPTTMFATNDPTQWLLELFAVVGCVVFIVVGVLYLAFAARRSRRLGMFHRSLVHAGG